MIHMNGTLISYISRICVIVSVEDRKLFSELQRQDQGEILFKSRDIHASSRNPVENILITYSLSTNLEVFIVI